MFSVTGDASTATTVAALGEVSCAIMFTGDPEPSVVCASEGGTFAYSGCTEVVPTLTAMGVATDGTEFP
jgi:hypothetical protein